jgi:protein TonB
VNGANGWIGRRTQVIEALGWSGAALLTLGIHAGAVAWMLRSEPVVAADSSPPAAIMIELAAAPEAMQTTQDEISPDLTSADVSVPQQAQKQQETPQQDQVAEPVPEPDEARPVEDEKVEDKTAVLEKAEVQLPPKPPKIEKKPKKDEPKREKKKPQPRRQRATADSQTMRQAEVQARQSDRMAAAQTASGVSSLSPAGWRSLLMAHLQRRKRALSGEHGRAKAYVRFAIDGTGKVLSANLVQSSGFGELDREAVALVHRASPVPVPPLGANRTITVPVGFNSN